MRRKVAMAAREAPASSSGRTAEMLQIARTRFYPNWWIHATEVRKTKNKPIYRVVVHSKADAQLARAAKPDFVTAEVEFRQSPDC